MATKLDLLAARKLAITKQVFLEGTRQRRRSTPVGRLLAVVNYDLAIETGLKTVIRALDPSTIPRGDFANLLRLSSAALARVSLELPEQAAAQRVRDVRNAAQHEGRLPTAEEETECEVLSRRFLNDLLTRVWDRDLDSIRLGELIGSERCRLALDDAEAAMTGGDYGTAVGKAAEALQWALVRVKSALVGRGDTWVRAILTEDTFGKPKASRDLTKSLERTQETVTYLALGLDYGDYLRFKTIAGSTHFVGGGRAIHTGSKQDPTDADGEFAIGYASEAIIQIESRVGSIERPFGREHWF